MDHNHDHHDMSSHGIATEVAKALVNGTLDVLSAVSNGTDLFHDQKSMTTHDHGSMTTHDHGSMTTHDHGSMTTHDHGSMTTHNHGGGGGGCGGGGGHGGHGGMIMYFHFGYENETVLFQGWTLNSVEALIGTCIGIFFLAIFYEGLKYFREYLYKKSAAAVVQYSSVSEPQLSNGNGATTIQPKPRTMSASDLDGIITIQPMQMLSGSHFAQTLLHLAQITLSYFLMLIVMTYNAWLMIAICAGSAVGYFLFGWSKAHVVDITEHCH
ncbi:high affinity copper uptake protein 1-like [Artemia franciscana]|nr:hypothetical protein QYM36_005413 [Artemia franciscana]KAK2719926.1 hypothetical protein QYM36_005413 [Artemia franciscana]KAK2719927.1 hypothetical protein QYM36_005413 [Artemia franciscana]KAK2719929.1 hypothetical protein QYM36_005413 [Artemia franciscana]KAK2719930.1 hypothetical protein QYM36_005413 [Artemia franciscana]